MKLDPEDEHLRGSLYILTLRTGHAYAYLNAQPPQPLHRALVGCVGLDVDHINGDTLDNRKVNLRNVTRSENNRNSDRVWGLSRFKGVVFHKPSGRWTARIKHHGRVYSLGYHRTEEAANERRLLKERELWGINPRRAFAFDEKVA